jgi:lipoprotein NlpI
MTRRLPTLSLLMGCLMITAAASAQVGARQAMEDGQSAFYAGRIADSLAAFDRVIELQPDSAPHLWQRGLSLYYADRFADGRMQFETHQTVNSADVENAAWHFLCVARIEGVEGARKHFIPITGDSRVPMAEVHQLFAGKAEPEAVIKAANAGPPESVRNQLCYAHLYLGLYFEAMKEAAKAREHMQKAAVDYAMDHYMGETARVHLKLRGWDKPTPPTQPSK